MRGVSVRRIVGFGNLTISQQLNTLQGYLKSQEILLFQYYQPNEGVRDGKNDCAEYFEDYCDDVIHYYSPNLQQEINQEVLDILREDIKCSMKAVQEKKKMAEELFIKMKEGDCTGISEEAMEDIKNVVITKLIKYNIDDQVHNFVTERMYGASPWILDEHGKLQNAGGAIWYRPLNEEEYINVLKRTPLFSCISLKDGEKLDDFSFGYVIQETADNYDLLVFSNN